MINKEKINKARRLLIDLALDEICSVDEFSDLYLHAYYVIAKLGLQRKTAEEGLFNKGDWSNPQCKEYLIKELEEFFKNTIRTGTGLNIINITSKLDYIAYSTYKEINRIINASKFYPPKNFQWKKYWNNIQNELNKIETNIVTMRRINPYSPNNHLISFFSENTFHPSNTLNVILEKDLNKAKVFNVILNSILFLVQFFF